MRGELAAIAALTERVAHDLHIFLHRALRIRQRPVQLLQPRQIPLSLRLALRKPHWHSDRGN